MVHKLVLFMVMVFGLIACDAANSPTPAKIQPAAPTLNVAQPASQLVPDLDLTGSYGCSMGIYMGGMVADMFAKVAIKQQGDTVTLEFADPPPFTGKLNGDGVTLISENTSQLALTIGDNGLSGGGTIKGTDNQFYPVDIYCPFNDAQ